MFGAVRELAPLRRPARPGKTRPDAGCLPGEGPPAAVARLHRPALLVSGNWSGQTLTDHRFDGREWFRAVTAGLLDDSGEDQDQADVDNPPVEKHRYLYRIARPGDRDVDPVEDRILRAIHNRQRTRLLLRIARDGPQATNVPATTPPQAA